MKLVLTATTPDEEKFRAEGEGPNLLAALGSLEQALRAKTGAPCLLADDDLLELDSDILDFQEMLNALRSRGRYMRCHMGDWENNFTLEAPEILARVEGASAVTPAAPLLQPKQSAPGDRAPGRGR